MGADAPVRREDSCSDNSEPAGSRSAEDLGVEPDDEDEDKGLGNRKKRKNRHTSEQIREMEKYETRIFTLFIVYIWKK